MGGGLLQLVAYGAQDAYLSGNPQITFWKGLYKRHTNFAMEPFRVNLTGQANWGVKHSAVLGRHADLLYSTYIEVVMPPGAFVNNDEGRLGYNLLKYVELDIGGQVIDRLYGEWLYIWDCLSSDAATSFKLQQMVGGGLNRGSVFVPQPTGCGVGQPATANRPGLPTTLYIPLFFFYTKNPAAALPLIALQYHEVKINIQWQDVKFIAGTYTGTVPPPVQAAVYVDYIYLDTEERRRMAQQSHEYLIEQTQYNEDKGITSYNNRIDLTFNHPVKELVWVVQPSEYTNCSIAKTLQPNGFQSVSLLTSYIDDGAGTGLVAGNILTYTGATPQVGQVVTGAGVAPNTVITSVTPLTSSATVSGPPQAVGPVTMFVGFMKLAPFAYDVPAVYEQWLQINGQDRLDKRYGDYFNKVQPYQHHTGVPGGLVGLVQNAVGMYMYSFALRPEEHQPSGTCNFSRIDTATIVMNMSGDADIDPDQDKTFDVRVYAVNYNILRVMSGMAGLAYSN